MRKTSLIWITLLLFLLLVQPQTQQSVQAQNTNQWTTPKRVPNYSDRARPPFLVADQMGGVHAFNFESNDAGAGAIYYRHWSVALGWSPPVDIVIPVQGSGGSTIQGAFIDDRGILSLIYYDGTELIGDIYYTSAFASVADRAQSWSKPLPIGTSAGPVVYASINGDGKGKFFVLYGGQQDGIGIYQTYSLDYGDTWSRPTPVSLINDNLKWPFSIKTMLDDQGRLHATWSLVTDRGVGDQVRYARMDTPGNWSHEVVLARREGTDYSTTWPSIMVRDQELLIIYQDSFPATRWMVQSRDGGNTWSLPVRPFREIGEYENAVLLKDSNSNIYMVLGNRTQDPEIHGMWFSKWTGSQWTALEPIISGPRTNRFDPSAPQAIVVQGNMILATWWHNVSVENLTGAWFSYIYLDSPVLPTLTLPVPTPESTPTPASTNTRISPILTSTPTEVIVGSFDTTPSGNTNPSLSVYLAVIPVVLIVLIIMGIRALRKPF